jgi:hypothetical protein
VARFAAASGQADEAVAVLRQAGFSQAEIDALADTALAQLSGSNPDPAIVEQQLVDQIERKLGRDQTVGLAQSFDRDHPTPSDTFDLGDVSTAVATASGYSCLTTIGN